MPSLQVIGVLETVVHEQARQHYRAFFSSVLGGITTNPALMTVHIDDHMVHRSVDGTPFRHLWNATISVVIVSNATTCSPANDDQSVLSVPSDASCDGE